MPITSSDLVLETGSGLETANTYQTLSGASGYFSRVGLADRWETFTADEQAAGLVSGSRYMGQRWRFVGYRATSGQALDWPRYGAYDADGYLRSLSGVPVAIQEAQCEYALLACEGTDLFPSPSDSSRGAISQRSETIGPHSESFTYARPLRLDLPRYPSADRILTKAGLVRGPRRVTVRG